MNEWKDNKSDNIAENTGNNLVISPRQLSFVVAGTIIVLFTTFLFGYFWGQKYAAEQFVDKIDNESFADQISSSLLSLQKNSDERMGKEPLVQANEEQFVFNKESDDKDILKEPDDPVVNENSYYAQLIGFGTLNAANQFVSRLQQKNIPLEVKKRTSKTARGKKITWYQVVTKKYNDKFVLEKLVETLKKDEKLKDPCIVIC